MKSRCRAMSGGKVVAAASLALFLATLSGGCGAGAASSSSSSEVAVRGTVTIKGKKADTGTVFFNPSNVNRKGAASIRAAIGKDGSYSLKTLVGRNVVSIDHPGLAKDPVLQYFTEMVDVEGTEMDHDILIPAPR